MRTRLRRVKSSSGMVMLVCFGLAAALLQAASPEGAGAALGNPAEVDGSIVRTVTAEGYDCSVGTGIAFDGTNLLLSCNYTNEIIAVDPADGSLVDTYVVPGLEAGIGALSYDRGRNQLWACGGFGGDDTAVYLIDLYQEVANLQFDGATGCPDGLAYDAGDDTLWSSPDVSPTIYHYSLTGTLIGTFSPPLGSCGNSGIAIGGSTLFLANNGCGEIYTSDRDTPEATTLFASYAARLEDLECDDLTFRSAGMTVIWSKDAYDGILNAFQVGSGDCGFGGNSSRVDDDGDGLPNTWESHGIYVDGQQVVDLPALGADPRHKDIFLRIDAERGAFMSGDSQEQLSRAYSRGPVPNPDGTTGIRLHYLRGRTINASASDALKRNGKPNYSKVFGRWKDDSPYQPLFAHHIVGVHWSDWGVSAQSAGIPAQIVVTNMCGKRRVANCTMSSRDQALYVMHELGHNLGLHHGGNDNTGFKPNYLSVMNYSFVFARQGIPGLGITYSRWGKNDIYTLDEASLVEGSGVSQPSGGERIPNGTKTIYYCPKTGQTKVVAVGEPIDWNCRDGIAQRRVKADINAPSDRRSRGYDASFNRLKSFDDWEHLVFKGGNIGRLSAPWVAGRPVS